MFSMKFALLLFCFFGLFSCQKDTFDYRNKYEGAWDVVQTTHIDSSDFGGTAIVEDVLTIKIAKGADDYTLLFYYDYGEGRPKFEANYIVKKRGEIFGNYSEGEFSRKSFMLNYDREVFYEENKIIKHTGTIKGEKQ